MNRMAMSSVVILLLGAAGCGGSESPPKAPEPPPASTAATPAGTTTSGMATGETRTGNPSLASSDMGPRGSQPSSAQPSGTPSDPRGTSAAVPGMSAGSSTSATPTALGDDQILYILHIANVGEMEEARVAQKKAQNARVKRFAAMMLKDHGEADAHGSEVAKRMNASLSPSDVSNRLETDAKQMAAAINAEKAGKDFDRTYIAAQVKEHRALLNAIDRDLLPSVKSAEVREFVLTMRPKVEGHLREAEDIQKGLEK